MSERIAVETLTLKEVSDLFKHSLETALPGVKGSITSKLEEFEKNKVSHYKWTQTYEIVKGAKLNLYCQKFDALSSPVVSIGMIHRTKRGLILVVADTSNGGIANWKARPKKWDNSVIIYTDHFCERYAERIMKQDLANFSTGCEGIMYADIGGIVRVLETDANGVEEIEFQFHEGQAYGYRDRSNKIVLYRTVYSNNMLRGDRNEFRNEWKASVAEIKEWFRWE